MLGNHIGIAYWSAETKIVFLLFRKVNKVIYRIYAITIRINFEER